MDNIYYKTSNGKFRLSYDSSTVGMFEFIMGCFTIAKSHPVQITKEEYGDTEEYVETFSTPFSKSCKIVKYKTISLKEKMVREYDEVLKTFKTLEQEVNEIRLKYFIKPVKWRKCEHKNVSDIGSVGFLPSITNDQARVYDGWCDDCGEHVFGLTNGFRTKYDQTILWKVPWTTNRKFIENFHGMSITENHCRYIEEKFFNKFRKEKVGLSKIKSYL